MNGKLIIILTVMAVLSNTALAYSGEVDFPELFKYNDEMNGNLETALHLISTSFNEKGVPVTQELLAAIMATLEKEVGGMYNKFLPKEEQWDYGMGEGCSNPNANGCKNDGIGHYEGGVDYKGRGYIQLTQKSNYEKYCPDCVGTSDENSDVCRCKNQEYCAETDPTICPQVKALQPERAASIFASYYLESPSGKNLVSLSNAENYFEVAHAINTGKAYNSKFETLAKDYLTLFRNNPDKTEKLLSWLNSGTMAAVDVLSIGIPVTLTLYVHDGDPSGSTISGVQVTGQDGAGHSFEQTTNSNGYVTITGIPGTWSFSASADGYETNRWSQPISETDRKDAFLQQGQQSPQNSVVGKWASHIEVEECAFPDGYNSNLPPELDTEFFFQRDGTLLADGKFFGEWVRDGDTIHITRGDPQDGALEGTIDGDTMSGTGFGMVHESCEECGYPYPYDYSCSISWTASRISSENSEYQGSYI